MSQSIKTKRRKLPFEVCFHLLTTKKNMTRIDPVLEYKTSNLNFIPSYLTMILWWNYGSELFPFIVCLVILNISTLGFTGMEDKRRVGEMKGKIKVIYCCYLADFISVWSELAVVAVDRIFHRWCCFCRNGELAKKMKFPNSYFLLLFLCLLFVVVYIVIGMENMKMER